MVTTVGTSDDFNVVIENLLQLEFAAIEAYEAAIERLESMEYKTALRDFVGDHHNHVRELTEAARTLGANVPEGPDAKVILTKGKVVLADLLGDKAILMAMKTNEDDTVTAYQRSTEHKKLPEAARDAVQKGLADEQKHRAWIVATLEKLENKKAA